MAKRRIAHIGITLKKHQRKCGSAAGERRMVAINTIVAEKVNVADGYMA